MEYRKTKLNIVIIDIVMTIFISISSSSTRSSSSQEHRSLNLNICRLSRTVDFPQPFNMRCLLQSDYIAKYMDQIIMQVYTLHVCSAYTCTCTCMYIRFCSKYVTIYEYITMHIYTRAYMYLVITKLQYIRLNQS